MIEIVGSCAERVCLDDVGAGLDVLGMNFLDQIRICQVQFVVAAINVDALGIEHRPHRAIEDVNAIGFEYVSERFHLVIADCRFPVADLEISKPASQLEIANRHSEMKSPRQIARDFMNARSCRFVF